MPNDAAPWAQGYVSDTSYTDSYFREYTPHHLNYVAALTSNEPRPLAPGYTYCELGCGRGQTINVLAAANPDGRFYACDFNPTHVAAARKLAEQGKLTNLTVLERNFEEMRSEALPEFDFIVLHGVWSWVSAANRGHIVDFIYRRLKPGGLVYVSYNALPGWAPVAPIRKLIQAVSETASGDSIAKSKAGLAFVNQLRAAKVKYVTANPGVDQFVTKLESMPAAYIAHEYINQNWDLFYSSDVARELAPAKLRFVGSATVVENHRALLLPKPQVEMLAALPSREMAELGQDFMINQRFRRDLFMRGGSPLPTAQVQQRLRNMAYGLLRPHADTEFKGRGPLSEYAFESPTARGIAAALAAGPRTVADIAKQPELARTPAAQLHQSLSLLLAAGQVVPCARANAAAAPAAGARFKVPLAFNRVILAESLDVPDHSTLASPLSGAGVAVDVVDRLFLAALATQPPADPVADVWSKFQPRGIGLKRDGKGLVGAEANIAELRRRYDDFRAKILPFLISMGIVEPA
jgi:SAM-dependent methyltransferase